MSCSCPKVSGVTAAPLVSSGPNLKTLTLELIIRSLLTIFGAYKLSSILVSANSLTKNLPSNSGLFITVFFQKVI